MLHSTSIGPFAADASIHLIASDVLDACMDDRLPPSLLSVAPEGDGFDLGLRPLGDAHPSELLVGFTAPERWYSIGVAARGWAYPLADRADPERRRSRVHLVSLVSRSGETAHVVRADDADHPLNSTSETPSGEQVDLLHRALGLPTPPPPCDSAVYWAIEWLSAILADDDVMTSWHDVCAAHPAARFLEVDEETDIDIDTQVITSQFAFARVLTWSRMREIAEGGAFGLPGISAADAAWFDDGSLARFILSRCPPLSFLRTQLDSALPPELVDKVDQTLIAMGLGGRTWPDSAQGSAA